MVCYKVQTVPGMTKHTDKIDEQVREQRLERAREVIRLEARTIAGLEALLDERFARAVGLVVGCRGKVVVTGMGKAGLIGAKVSATLASTGTDSLFLHPAEALHGDLGRIRGRDLVLALSNSGETVEIKLLVPAVRVPKQPVPSSGEPASARAVAVGLRPLPRGSGRSRGRE